MVDEPVVVSVVLPVVPLMPLLEPDPVVPLVLLPVVPVEPVVLLVPVEPMVPEDPVVPVEPVVPDEPVEPVVPACPVVVSREVVEPLRLVLLGMVLDEPVAALPDAFELLGGVAPPCVACGVEALGLPPELPPLAPPPCANASPVARARAADVARISCFFMGDSCVKSDGVAE